MSCILIFRYCTGQIRKIGKQFIAQSYLFMTIYCAHPGNLVLNDKRPTLMNQASFASRFLLFPVE